MADAADVAARTAALRERMANEPSERVLLAEIERTLEPLRVAYGEDRALFSPEALATLKRAAEIAKGLKLFIEVVGEIGDLSDLAGYARVERELHALAVQFHGTAVATRVQHELVNLHELRSMIGVLDPPTD